MIKLLLVVTTMYVAGYDVKTTEVVDVQKCVADAPSVLQGAEMVRGVRGAKVECVERKQADAASPWQDDVKISLASQGWVEPATRPTTSRFEYDASRDYGRDYGRDTYYNGYDTWGYDRWGYDQWGYDRWGYDRWGYDRWGYPRHGYSRNYNYNYNYGQVPAWANPWPNQDLCTTYPGHPSCRYQGAPDWHRGPGHAVPNSAQPIPNNAQPIPNPARPVNQ